MIIMHPDSWDKIAIRVQDDLSEWMNEWEWLTDKGRLSPRVACQLIRSDRVYKCPFGNFIIID